MNTRANGLWAGIIETWRSDVPDAAALNGRFQLKGVKRYDMDAGVGTVKSFLGKEDVTDEEIAAWEKSDGVHLSRYNARRLIQTVKILRQGLRESVKLQSHYAQLLNMYDGGQRLQFDMESWLDRLMLLKLEASIKAREERQYGQTNT